MQANKIWIKRKDQRLEKQTRKCWPELCIFKKAREAKTARIKGKVEIYWIRKVIEQPMQKKGRVLTWKHVNYTFGE